MSGSDIFIGNYGVISELGSGAFGRVFLARHMILSNRTVAIKLMHSMYLNSEEEFIRFLEEAQFLEKLKHPHILPIIDVSFYEGFPYLVTEYASKGSLREMLQNHSSQLLPLQKSIAILTQIGQALTHAHKHNIVHRDLKPENILFNENEDVLIADFGLATVLGSTSVKETNTTGTMAYMAPEQFHDMVCRESDQYALGCIAYELFTGHMPFVASNIASLITKCLMEKPVPPRTHNPQLPIHIENAILKAMAKDRNERFASVSAFVEALTQSTDKPTKKTKEEWINLFVALGMTPSFKERIILECDKALQEHEDFADAYYYKAVALNDLQRYNEAFVNFEYFIRLEPNCTMAWYFRGDLLKHFGRSEEAQKAYDRAKELEKIDNEEDEEDEEEDDYYENLFDTHQYTAQTSEQVDTPKPSSAEKYNEIGLAFQDEHKLQEALHAFEEAIRLKPDYALAWCHKGNVLTQLFEFERALEAYYHSIQLNARYVPSYLGLGKIQLGLGNPKEALASFEIAIQLDASMAYAWLNKGDALIDLDMYTEALNSIEHAIQLNPRCSGAYTSKGIALKNLNRYNEALAAYDTAIKFEPDEAMAYNNKGNLLHELQRDEEALICFEHAIRLEPYLIMAYTGKGNALRGLQRYKEALEAHEAAIIISPSYNLAHINKGNILNELDRYEEALDAYNKALQIDPHHANAYYGKGLALWKLGQYNQSLTNFNQALQLNPKHAYAHYAKGNVLKDIGHNDQAIEAYILAIQLDPSQAPFYVGIGDLLLDAGYYDKAVESYDKALQLNPGDFHAYLGIGRGFWHLKNYNQALLAFQMALQLNPNSAAAYNGLGDVYGSQKRYQEAIGAFDKAMQLTLTANFQGTRKEIHSTLLESYTGKGLAFFKLENYINACTNLEKALQLEPDNSVILEVLGRTLSLLNRNPDALAVFERIIRLVPNYANAYIEKGVALAALGYIEEAYKAFSHAIKLDPDDPTAYFCQGLSLRQLGRIREAEKIEKQGNKIAKRNRSSSK